MPSALPSVVGGTVTIASRAPFGGEPRQGVVHTAEDDIIRKRCVRGERPSADEEIEPLPVTEPHDNVRVRTRERAAHSAFHERVADLRTDHRPLATCGVDLSADDPAPDDRSLVDNDAGMLPGCPQSRIEAAGDRIAEEKDAVDHTVHQRLVADLGVDGVEGLSGFGGRGTSAS
jgi:hypothetical protein